jgi:hypothetical protein
MTKDETMLALSERLLQLANDEGTAQIHDVAIKIAALVSHLAQEPPVKPVAWLVNSKAGIEVFLYEHNANATAKVQGGNVRPLYVAPPAESSPTDTFRETVRKIGAVREKRLAEVIEENSRLRAQLQSPAERVERPRVKVPAIMQAAVCSGSIPCASPRVSRRTRYLILLSDGPGRSVMAKRYYGTDAPRSTGPHPDPLSETEEEKRNTREIMDKIYAMTPEEFNRFMHEHFERLWRKSIPNGDRNGAYAVRCTNSSSEGHRAGADETRFFLWVGADEVWQWRAPYQSERSYGQQADIARHDRAVGHRRRSAGLNYTDNRTWTRRIGGYCFILTEDRA